MNTASDDALLAALLAGDLDPQEPAVAARLSRDRALAQRWSELRALAADLDAEGRARREALAPATPAEVARTERMLRVARSGGRPILRPAWGRRLAAAAALLVIVGGGYVAWRATRTDDPERGRDFLLGDDAPWISSPTGVWRAGEALSWSLALPAGGRFRVTILDADTGAVILERPPLEAPAWNLEPTEFRRLPEFVDVRIEVLDTDGTIADVRSARLSVSR